ncbi:fibronectin type III domain-containing protein [Isoptericola sp. b490]|uniref:fibronectin type III domain-containing protein n=1 Tax=Actinotalea lenta TaxID=3064654 RepID=UPI0027126511|nr:fibronectin type III domain-containing protein [Isoptericola sp. b490]MDO8122485.1 fibronectin type III domain-containing protein [Isoptericola sp. b490]
MTHHGPARGRRWPSVVGALAAPAALIAMAVVYPGATVSQVDLNDASVWVTRGPSMQLARWNAQVGELNAGLVAEQPGFDVQQDGDQVMLVQPGSISRVDPASVTIAGTATVASDDQVSMAHGVVSVLQPDGDLWVLPLDEVGTLDTTTEPDVRLGPGASAVVSRTSGDVLATTSSGQLHRLRLDPAVSDRVVGSMRGQTSPAQSATAVGDVLVTVTGTTVHTPTASVDLAQWGPDLVLQQPGPRADSVLVATPDALLEVPLSGGPVVAHRQGGSGAPAAPVRVAGCANGAWAAVRASYLQVCGDRTRTVDLEGMTGGAELRFRVNRDVVVLNDVSGNLWAPTVDATLRQANWREVVPEEQTDTGQQASDQRSTQTLQAECTPQSAPARAVDDSYGVRPGRTTILSVIDNDSASDCGLLAISDLDPLPASFGTIVPIYGGRAIQLVTAAGASGAVRFTYTVTDGRGASAPSTATVTLEVVPDGVNRPPRQQRVSQVQVERGATGTFDVLPDFVDPDGDQLVLLGATVDGGGSVRTRQDGELTFSSDGTTLGRRTVQLLVGDGQATATGELQVDIRPAGSLAPVIDPVHAVTYVGQPVTVRPLDSVRSASREPVRLAGVDELTGATITPDLAAGTFTFSAARAGTYYVSFVVTAAPQQTTGVARIDVAEKPQSVEPPTAVLDVALLPPGGEVVVDPLANDVDPGGAVLVLQSVDVPEGSGLEVAVLNHQLVRISATRTLSGPVTVPYTISNGAAAATGELRVKPIDASSTQQPPVVPDVVATVRTGGVVTIPVLDGAYDPDGDPLHLERTLVQPPEEGQGLMFVSGDVLRYQAPDTPMRVHATFQVSDPESNATAARVTVEVHASDRTSKSPPHPKDLTARVFEAETIRIPIPLTGIDPDGDGVSLLGQDKAPSKGRIVNQGADWLEYEALPGELGTDTFSYAVEDWVGQRAVATIRVGIAARPQAPAQVVARNDDVTVRPGQSVAVRVLANDVDTSGGTLTLDPELQMAAGTDAHVDNRRIVVRTPLEPATLQIAYTASNARGGRDSAVLTVVVDPDAPILAPLAQDVVVPATQTLNASSVEVNVLEVADNPSGPLSDLRVSVDSSAADVAHVTPSGTVVVALGPQPRTLPYLLTNVAPDAGGVSSYAFITVPALGDFPPVRRPGAPDLVVLAGASLSISLDEQIQVAPGRTVRVADPTAVSATKSDGSDLVVDSRTLRYRAVKTYAGPASITVPVSDGPADDPTARTAVLTLPITVLAFEDHPPTFTPSVLDVPQGESTRVDLTAFTSAPIGAQSPQSTYAYLLTSSPPRGVTMTLDGSVLTLSVATSVARGTVGGVGLSIDYGGLGALPAQVDFRVVASSKPLARVVDQRIGTGVRGQVTAVRALAGAFNPFPAPLTLMAAVPDDPASGQAWVEGDQVMIRPAADFLGPMAVRFRVRDVTADPDREVEGRITLVVRGRPDAPAAPRISEVGDQTVTLAWDAPPANGEPITGYRVTAEPGGPTVDCPSTTCTVAGLTNDVDYTFTVVAQNAVGDSDPSPASGPARPDVKPAAPGAPTLAWGDAKVTASWEPPANTGSPIREYQVEISPAPSAGTAVVTSASTSVSFASLTNGTSYTVRVRAVNDAPDPGDWSMWSTPQVPAAVPSAPGGVTATRSKVGPGGTQITVTWAPAAAHGDPVSGYEVRVDGAVTSVGGDATSYTFPAQRGQTYQIDVRASNKAGAGAWASTTGEIWTAPGAVTGLVVSDDSIEPTPFGQAAVQVRWTAPADTGGVPLSGYDVSVDGAQPVRVGPDQTSVRLTGLAGGDHTVSVLAVNTKGAAGPAVSASVTLRTVPQQPTDVRGENLPDSAQVQFTWQPGVDGGSAITGYRYELVRTPPAAPDGSTPPPVTVTGSVATPALVVDGTGGETLTLTVWALNAEGASLASATAQVVVVDDSTPPTTPPPTTPPPTDSPTTPPPTTPPPTTPPPTDSPTTPPPAP